MILIKENTK